ncbi:hypothetical protein BFJ65_g6967 [Fusarium oxysporum f. sp. cepae]|nr:hypothetical protein BFJ65_g6967 [Fusarium oxysporum f. sp. cepae]
MAKHVQRQQNHLAKECLGFQQAAGHVDRQPRITTALSIMDRNSKDQLDRAAALAIFKSGKPYTTFEDSGMVEFIQQLNPAYKPPSGDRIATILPEVYQDYRVQVKEILDDADHLNVIFDASDDISSNRIVNISISIPNSVTFYWKTVNTRNEEHTALNTIRLIQPLLEEVFTKEGEDFQDFSRMNAICTDTCSTMRKLHAEMKNMPEFRHCFFLLCDSHGLQLLVKDIVESERWASVLKKVTRIITFFKKAKLQLARLRAYQLECYGKQKAFITPAITRWGTQLGAVMSSLANKDALRAYARDAMVLNSLKAKAIKGEEEEEEDQQVLRAILSSINNFEFWHEVEMLAKILRPIENAQRCSERDHSCVGEVIPRWLTIQSRWDALEEANQDPLINYSELRQWRVQRMKGQTTDIHHFAFALDPRTTIGEGLGLDTMERAHRFLEENTSNEEYQQLFGEFCRFRAREGALFGPTSRIYREQPKTPHTPSHYYILSAWGYFGSMGVKLATLARRVLGSLANSVPSERSFSATNYLHCKLRNRLSPLSTDKVTFIYMNSRVLKRLKTVKDNPAEPMVVKNWETVDVARFKKRISSVPSSGNHSWESLFGPGTAADEAFMAHLISSYVGRVAAAGKAEYPIPLYTNTWLNIEGQSELDFGGGAPVVVGGGDKPGIYPSGGPCPHVLDIWRFNTPSLDLLAPDLYFHDYETVCRNYTEQGNTLFIPEQRRDEYGARRIWLSYATYGALGASPFGIDTGSDVIGREFKLLNQTKQYFLDAAPEDRFGFFFDEEPSEKKPEQWTRTFGDIKVIVERCFVFGKPGPGAGMIIHLGNSKFLLVGRGFHARFKAARKDATFGGILWGEEKEVDENGNLQTLRILNGDETRHGEFMMMPNDDPDYGGFPIAVTPGARTCIAEVEAYWIAEDEDDR